MWSAKPAVKAYSAERVVHCQCGDKACKVQQYFPLYLCKKHNIKSNAWLESTAYISTARSMRCIEQTKIYLREPKTREILRETRTRKRSHCEHRTEKEEKIKNPIAPSSTAMFVVQRVSKKPKTLTSHQFSQHQSPSQPFATFVKTPSQTWSPSNSLDPENPHAYVQMLKCGMSYKKEEVVASCVCGECSCSCDFGSKQARNAGEQARKSE